MKDYNIKYNRDFKWDVPKMLQGDLAYIIHPNKDRQGWYQKLRKRENGKVGYLQITGVEIGTFVSNDTVERPFQNCWDSRVTHVVRGGEEVALFLGKNYQYEEVVECLGEKRILSKIKSLEKELSELKEIVGSGDCLNYL